MDTDRERLNLNSNLKSKSSQFDVGGFGVDPIFRPCYIRQLLRFGPGTLPRPRQPKSNLLRLTIATDPVPFMASTPAEKILKGTSGVDLACHSTITPLRHYAITPSMNPKCIFTFTERLTTHDVITVSHGWSTANLTASGRQSV